LYGYQTLALKIGGTANFSLEKLNAKHILKLGKEFDLNEEVIWMAAQHLAKFKEAAMEAIVEAPFQEAALKNQLTEIIQKRWNETFALIGNHLSKKR
jgi:serine/threonine-protein kinase HipA